MDYASSYAVGRTQQLDVVDAATVLPPPKPQRMHWATIVFAAGMGVCFVALLATVAGVPGSMAYDIDGAPHRNKPGSNPLKMTHSIDGNMKWIEQASSDSDGGYVGYIKSVNRNEAVIAPMAEAVLAMSKSVQTIDGGLGEVHATTERLGDDMSAMADTSQRSADAMRGLVGSVGFLSRTMTQLATTTTQLTQRMGSIEGKVSGIAENGTSTALATTKQLNGVLPAKVPAPVLETIATGGGTADVPLQPAPPPDAYINGDVQ